MALVVLALAPSAAHAHRLSPGKALKAAKAVALDVAHGLDGQTLEDGVVIHVEEVAAGACKRRSVHRFNCLIGHGGP
ncbi:MAG: hypothetical protein M3N16_05185 [Actinomycetota bacterium]|nr:hypothetical protein [Actinomycetota bacterium]